MSNSKYKKKTLYTLQNIQNSNIIYKTAFLITCTSAQFSIPEFTIYVGIFISESFIL